MSVEARIREMLLSSQKNLNEVASSGNDNTNPKQGNSKDASFDDLGDFDKQKPTVATGKDNSASSKAAIAGDSTNPKQGSSKDATWEDLDDTDLGKKASAKMSKDTSIKPAIKGDTRNEETESDEDDVLQDEFDDEELDEAKTMTAHHKKIALKVHQALSHNDGMSALYGQQIRKAHDDLRSMYGKDWRKKAGINEEVEMDEEVLDELSKKTLGSYIKKNSRSRIDLAAKEKELTNDRAAMGRLSSYNARMKSDDVNDAIDKELRKVRDKDYNRQDGLNRAVKKLTKEEIESIFGTDLTEDQIDEETLDELSKKTLGSYITKASKSRADLAVAIDRTDKDAQAIVDRSYGHGKEVGDAAYAVKSALRNKERKFIDKEDRRGEGIRRAVKKLTKEEIESIFGTDLTEEFQTKATEIFEAAVIARVNDEVMAIEEELEEAYETAYTDALEESTKELVEKLDSYLDYVVDQWLEENKIAVEQGLKLEVMEGFMDGLKGLFQEHYIEVPDEKFDVLESMQAQIDELKGKLNEEIERNIDNAKLVQEAKRLEVLEKASIGLADTEVERFEKLIEGIEFKDPDVYLEKLQIIRKNHFTKALEEGSILEAESGANIKVGDDRISRYAQAISRSVKK